MANFIQPIPFSMLFALAPFIVAISGCSTIPSKNTPPTRLTNPNPILYPSIDSGLSEKLYPNEQEIATGIADVIEQSIRQQYASGTARRDAHPKAHGCVRAEFHVMEALPNQLAKGIFIPGQTYQAWIRFSNGSRDAKNADIKRDARGMAIKLLGVSGEKLLEDEKYATTQDFIMINHPVFFVNDPRRYMSLMQDINSESFFRKLHLPFGLGAKGTFIALNLNTQISNPLQTRYWSMVPYQLGIGPDRQAVKYSVRSCSAKTAPIPKKPSHDFLRDVLRESLQKGDACMEFLVQPRTSNKLAIEDSMTEWKESQAPFYQVATIRIPQQVFDTPDQNKFCENLSFTPWHALPEHRPLGSVNRLRKVIYDRISRVRHEMNSAKRQEPL
ncbi:catalase family protein [Acinetobacter sp. ANC 4648]|uniref:catalase family protein n=1 Tax=Acinetobacter sp. ANC 4648 TaxID=1977875 RepID=UPI000A34B163|nr:catalase family protein [Acinetobacter sp. ANC 4648]OTG83647.1 catalase [Acinetobacter sp. ANC 4648]